MGNQLEKKENHSDEINAIIALRDGKVATGSEDATIRIWCKTRHRTVAILNGGNGPVRSLVPLLDNRVAGGCYSVIQLWDLARRTCVRRIEGKSDFMLSIDNSLIWSNNQWLAVYSILSYQVFSKLRFDQRLENVVGLPSRKMAYSFNNQIAICSFIRLREYVLIGEEHIIDLIHLRSCLIASSSRSKVTIWNLETRHKITIINVVDVFFLAGGRSHCFSRAKEECIPIIKEGG